MAVVGSCRARPTWTDRLGRLAGAGRLVVGTSGLHDAVLVS